MTELVKNKGGRPKKKHAGGRPTKIDEKTEQKLREAFSIDASVEESCYYASISKQTFYNLQKTNRKLFDELERLRERPVLIARQTVVKGINSDPDLALKYLERKRKKEFSTRQEIENSGELKLEVNVEKQAEIARALEDL